MGVRVCSGFGVEVGVCCVFVAAAARRDVVCVVTRRFCFCTVGDGGGRTSSFVYSSPNAPSSNLKI